MEILLKQEEKTKRKWWTRSLPIKKKSKPLNHNLRTTLQYLDIKNKGIPSKEGKTNAQKNENWHTLSIDINIFKLVLKDLNIVFQPNNPKIEKKTQSHKTFAFLLHQKLQKLINSN